MVAAGVADAYRRSASREHALLIDSIRTDTLPGELGRIGSALPAQRLLQALENGRRRFLRELPGRLRRVVEAARRADHHASGAVVDREARLRRELHALIGTAGTLGFVSIGEQAMALHGQLGAQGAESGVAQAARDAALHGLVAAGLRARLSSSLVGEPSRCAAAAQRILVVDDDDIQRSVIQASLELAGYSAESLADADAVPSALAARPAALLVLDWDLGPSSGADVLRALRAEPATRDLPVVVFSSHEQDAAVFEMFDAGATAFASKLDTVQALIDRVGQQINAQLHDRSEVG